MYQLAFADLVDAAGKELKIPAADVKEVKETSVGCKVTMRDGTVYDLQTTAAATLTELDRLWGEYITALTGV